MTVALALIRKNLIDSRWMLAAIAPSLFGLTWLFVHIAHRIEAGMREMGGGRSAGMLRGLGGSSMNFSTAAIELAFWNHPFVVLLFAIWAIARGSGAVAGEIEKGTMDLVMSRPVARPVFLVAQVASAAIGILALAASMIAGNLVGTRYNTLETPATALDLARPALNLVAFGWAIYGYTFLLSTVDHLRWRPNLIASVATLAMYIARIVATIPSLEEDYGWLNKISIFKAYDPVEAVVKGEALAFNAGLLGAIGGVGVGLGFFLFSRRDLPAGS